MSVVEPPNKAKVKSKKKENWFEAPEFIHGK